MRHSLKIEADFQTNFLFGFFDQMQIRIVCLGEFLNRRRQLRQPGRRKPPVPVAIVHIRSGLYRPAFLPHPGFKFGVVQRLGTDKPVGCDAIGKPRCPP